MLMLMLILMPLCYLWWQVARHHLILRREHEAMTSIVAHMSQMANEPKESEY